MPITCKAADCFKRASYGPLNGKPDSCVTHKASGYILLSGNRCTFDKCLTTSVFGFPDGKPSYCLAHKPKDAINLVNPTCFSPDCNKQPSYNDPGKQPIACRAHKSDTMICIRVSPSFFCRHPGCVKQSNFGLKGSRATFCRDHAAEGSVNLRNMIRCHEPGCEIKCSYGIDAPTHCKAHASNLMRNLVNRMCSSCDKVRAFYGYHGIKPSSCSKCKVPGMIYRPTKVCCKVACHNYALYGLIKPERCDLHKLPTDKNLIEGHCAKCNLTMPLINDLCEFCRPRFIKSKELQVKGTLTQYNLENNLSFYSHDQVIDSKCNLRRPDFVYDAGTHFLVVEVDEAQHRSYAKECEQSRMWSIRQALGLPTTFIRFNPDSFKTAAGRPGRASDAKREEVLCKWLNTLLKIEPAHSCSALYLFYDGWREGSSVKVEEVPHPVLK